MYDIKTLLDYTKVNHETAFKELKEYVKEADENVQERFFDCGEQIIAESEPLLTMIEQSVANNNYIHCARGIFGASIFDTDTKKNMVGPAFNKPAAAVKDLCRFEEGTCTRMLGNPVHGAGYDACPSTHARERLSVPMKHRNAASLIWVEGGAYLNKQNKLEISNIDELPLGIYPCIRCLNYSMTEDVRVLAHFNWDPVYKWGIKFYSVDAHLKLRLVENALKQAGKYDI